MNIATESFDSVPSRRVARRRTNTRTDILLASLESLVVKQKRVITPEAHMDADKAKKYLNNIQQDVYKLRSKLNYKPTVRRENNVLSIYRVEGSDFISDGKGGFVLDSDGNRITQNEKTLQNLAANLD